MCSPEENMRKVMQLTSVPLVTLAILGGALLCGCNSKRIERRLDDSATVSGVTVPIGEAAASSLLREAFGRHSGPVKFGRFQACAATDPRFPDDYQLNAFSRDNPSLREYLSIDPSSRKCDLYVIPPYATPEAAAESTDYYWRSEYYYNDQPARFRSKFIVHLSSPGRQLTRLDVIEFQPQIWVGKDFHIFGHAGPGFYDDVRFVGPTAKDRFELLDYLKSVLEDVRPN
jgi:hypothetical protein